MVAAFIVWVKVAVNTVPLTTLAGLLLLVATLVAAFAGVAEPTVGSNAAAPALPAAPGTATAPGAALKLAVLPPPLPQPVTKAATINTRHPGIDLERVLNLFI